MKDDKQWYQGFMTGFAVAGFAITLGLMIKDWIS